MNRQKVNRQKVEKQISKKLREIWKIYHGAYPEGKYLTMFIKDGYIHFNNVYCREDKLFPIDHFESLQESQE